MKTRTPVLAILVVCVLLAWTAAAHAQAGERALQLDTELEKGLEQAVAYVAVEYQKPNSTRRYIESGTGFFVAPTHLITNHHVIAPSITGRNAEIKVRLFSGTRQAQVFPAIVLKSDATVDLALLAVQGGLPAIKPVRISPDLPGRQTEVFAFGFPLGTMLDRSVNGPNVCLRRGYVSRMINDGSNIEADLNIDKGLSGGPLVDYNGVVRGVVRAMAGSEYNKNFAAISVSSPVLLEFCRTSGVAVTLHDGTTRAAGEAAATQATAPAEPASRPRVGLAEDVLRTFFAIGASLRLSSLVPGLLHLEKAAYTPDLLQTSKSTADQVLSSLQRIAAPGELVARARELTRLLSDARIQPPTVREKSEVLEEACDEWTREAPVDERLNYDLGAWLTELSLGLIDVSAGRDSRYCAFFLDSARSAGAAPEIIALLSRLQTNLKACERGKTELLVRAIGKDAERLIGIGYLATTAPELNPIQKQLPPALPLPAQNNRLQYPL